MNGRRFLRFTGWLYETGEFLPGIGWETERVRQRPNPDPDTRIELVGDDDAVLISRAAEVRVPTCGSAELAPATRNRIVGYVPLLPGARAVVLRVGDQMMHRTELAPEPPRVSIAGVDHGDGEVHLQWEAEHDRPLWFNVFIHDGRRTIPVGLELTDQRLTIDTATLPGGPNCTAAVLATDGLRSSVAHSEAFELPLSPPRATILRPTVDEHLSPVEPFSLVGSAYDAAGEPISADAFVWLIDDVVVARGEQLLAAGPLPPGDHRIVLQVVRDDGPAAQADVALTIPDLTPEQEHWHSVATAFA